MKNNLILLFAMLIMSLAAVGQGITGGAGVCHVDDDPDNITALQTQDARYECVVAVDENTGDIYSYDGTQTLGSRWNITNAGGESTTVSDGQSIDFTLSGMDITAEIIVDPAAGNQLTTSGSGAFVAADGDGSDTNEAQSLNVTSNATSATLTVTAANGAGGGSGTIAEGTGIDVSESGGTITVTNTEASQGEFANHAAAATGGVAIGEFYYASTANSMGAVPGTKIRRMF